MQSGRWPGLPDDDAMAMVARFRLFGERWFADSSALYAFLSLQVGDDPEVAGLLLVAAADQRWPTLFFAAVHLLLIRDPEEALAAFFPDLAESPRPLEQAYPVLREFCLRRAQEMTTLMATRQVQTNEVGRCAFLLPALEEISRRVEQKALALVEVGCSAGLNLLIDRYRLDYGSLGAVGPATSAVVVRAEVRGEGRPPIPAAFPPIASRVGVEINPLRADNPEDRLWLRACIWPEHRERLQTLTAALEVARRQPPPIVTGDAFELLPQVIGEISPDAYPVVIHTQVVPYFPADADPPWPDVVAGVAATRDLAWLFCESTIVARAILRPSPELEDLSLEGFPLALVTFTGGTQREELLALTDAHGTWLEWRRG